MTSVLDVRHLVGKWTSGGFHFMYVLPSQDEHFCGGLPAYELTVPDTKMGISAENG